MVGVRGHEFRGLRVAVELPHGLLRRPRQLEGQVYALAPVVALGQAARLARVGRGWGEWCESEAAAQP